MLLDTDRHRAQRTALVDAIVLQEIGGGFVELDLADVRGDR
jgi:hypothetical protein